MMINKCESTKWCIKAEICVYLCVNYQVKIRCEGKKYCFSAISTNVSIKMSHSI